MYFKAPERKHVHISRREGCYNLLSSDTMAQYSFHFPELSREQLEELGLRTFYNLTLDEDYNWEDENPLDCAIEIKDVIDGYWMNSSKDDINKLVEYLESIEEEQEELRRQYEIEYAKAKVEYWTGKLEKVSL